MGYSLFDVHSLNYDNEVVSDAYTPNQISGGVGNREPASVLMILLCASDSADPTVLNIDLDPPPTTAPVRLASVTIPPGSGHNGVPPVDCLAAVTACPAGLLLIPPMVNINISFEAAPTSGTTFTYYILQGIF